MEGGVGPDWQDDAAAAVALWAASEGRGGRRPELTTLGEARPEGDGWYAVDLRGKQVHPDQLEGLRLSPAGGERHHRVMQSVQEGEILRVRVARHVADSGLRLRAVKRPPGLLLESLRDSLRRLVDAGGCAHRLAHGRIDRLPAGSAEHAPAELTAGQRQALEACLTPGVRLVWGPPGTGKTRVLAEAIDRLLERGRRVLLVSGTNVAVDNALLGAMRIRRRGPGALVRVGTPHIRTVAEDDSVSLPRLVASRAAHLERERGRVEDRLAAMGSGSSRLHELDELLNGYDPAAHAAAAGLLETDHRVRALAHRLHDVRTAAGAARLACEDAERAQTVAESAWRTIEPARAHLDETARLRRELEELEVAANRAGAAHQEVVRRQGAMRAHLAEAESAGGMARLRNRGEVRRLREEVARLDGPVNRAALAEAAAVRRAEDRRRLLAPHIAEHQAAARLDEAQIQWCLAELEAARERAGEMARLAEDASRQEAAAQVELLAAESQPRATDEQRRLVADADAGGWPALHAERERLRSRLRGRAQEIERLERRHERLLRDLERLERNAEREIISQARLVATTLARFRLHSDVAAGSYDTVLVDEVGAAPLAEVLVPVAAARQTAVLLGDFLQLGPVLGDGMKHSPSPQVRRWIRSTCFDHCGIRSPDEALRAAGCAVLDTQYRFGPDVMELANRAMYAGALRAGGPRRRSELEPEVVLIDTDGLGELGEARPAGRSRWWPAGSLLAAILAEHHAGRGRRVGLIAPYRPQADAVLQALLDTEGTGTGPPAEVGTAHAFQGREFDVVVFDLVEDGTWPGWIAKSHLTARSEGARILNVGVTRCRIRLYLIGSAELVRSTRLSPRMALTPVRELLDAGRVHVVPASRLLQVPETGSPTERDPVVDELAETLARHVRVVGIHDEHTYYRELQRRLEEARESVWLWSPWTARRTEELLPALRAARDRGCRVNVFALTDQDEGMATNVGRWELARLREAVTRVVQVHRMHQKIVVVDERTVLYGSLNTLSHRDRRELMVVHQGAHFARKLLEHEHADVFAAPPSCRCSEQAALRRSGSTRDGRAWYWRCAARLCPWEERVSLGEERRA